MKRKSRTFAVAALLAAAAGCTPPEADPAGAPDVETTTAALGGPTTLTVTMPAGGSLQSTILSAGSSLLIDSRSTVASATAPAKVASFGTSQTQLQSSARINGDLSSTPGVFLGSSAAVTGFLKTGGTVTAQQGATVGGATTQNTTIGQTPFSWTVSLPTTAGPAITLFSNQSSAPAPGNYGAATVYSGAKISLRTGTYFFSAFDSEPGSTVALDETIGPVVIYVTGTTTLRGAFAVTGGTTGTNLLLVSLGTGVVDVATPLAGTIVAPSATVNLDRPNNNQAHVGQVFASKIELFSNATLNLGPFDWNIFCPQGDSDGDGVPDCTDLCPADAAKTAPGVCGCGVAETDSDGDGIADCVDLCPSDPNKTIPGQCGCAGPGAAPAGTPCSDGVCIGVTARELACNGAGQCGDPNACSPDPGHCTAKIIDSKIFWICNDSVTWAQAAAKCASVPGQSLARLDNRTVNAQLGHVVNAQVWIGGNDQTTAGTWQWTAGAAPNGDTFFTAGAPVSGRFTNFVAPAPGDNAGKCVAMKAGGQGAWVDQNCATAQGFVCMRSALAYGGPDVPPLACNDFSPNLTCPGPFTNCVTSDPSLSETADQFKADVNNCQAANCTQDGDPGCAQCTGAASIPPPGSTCTPVGTTPCGITNAHGTCTTNADCAAGEICDLAPGCTLCDTTSGSDCIQTCPANKLQCGTPKPGCAQPTTGTERCAEVNICAPPSATGDSNPFNDPTTDLAPVAFDPATEFTPAPPKTQVYPPDPACANPPCVLGTAHPWCKYAVANPLQDQKPGHAKHGKSGSGSVIEFNFDPNLKLAFTNEKSFGLGETKFALTARGEFEAGVSFNFSSFPHSDFQILDAVADLEGRRCRAWTTDSKLVIFGIDFLPQLLPEVLFDTNADTEDFPKLLDQKSCEDAFGEFETLFNRAKKAMKDAQELLTQYNALKAGGKALSADLCNEIASDPPFGFPPGNCATDSPEATINRFITYYENELNTAIKKQVQLAANELKFTKNFPIGDDDHEEDQTLFATTFAIGPIPVTLDIESVEHYGIGGGLTFTVNPGSILAGSSREQLAHVTGEVHPYANAGVSLSLGVGFDFGIIAATAGVEGLITLGNIKVPVKAGVGIDVQPAPDNRPLPSDLAAVADAVPFLKPTEYQFLMTFEYGAEVDINQILAGQLNLRVHVAFLFFSKTWRVTLASFKGFSLPPLVLFKGKSGDTALGDLPWATLQMPNPFPTLKRLAIPPAGGGGQGTGGSAGGGAGGAGGASSGPPQQVPVDTSKVEKFFFDSECQCIAPGGDCHRSADCCAAAPLCFHDPATLSGVPSTCTTCRQTFSSCNKDSDCCPGNTLGCTATADTAGAPKACLVCLAPGRLCDPNNNKCCDLCVADDSTNPNTLFHCTEPLK